MNVAVRDLKNRLSEFLRAVQAGERLIVTDRGRPIAEIGVAGRGRLTAKQRLQRLVESGEVTPRKGRGLAAFVPRRVRGSAVSRTILDDRD